MKTSQQDQTHNWMIDVVQLLTVGNNSRNGWGFGNFQSSQNISGISSMTNLEVDCNHFAKSTSDISLTAVSGWAFFAESEQYRITNFKNDWVVFMIDVILLIVIFNGKSIVKQTDLKIMTHCAELKLHSFWQERKHWAGQTALLRI